MLVRLVNYITKDFVRYNPNIVLQADFARTQQLFLGNCRNLYARHRLSETVGGFFVW